MEKSSISSEMIFLQTSLAHSVSGECMWIYAFLGLNDRYTYIHTTHSVNWTCDRLFSSHWAQVYDNRRFTKW